ncbi:zinc finger protein 225 [Lingula anatina]|uniref:Zinc finger protein 225 n=1 Tax=Lingula anatina TaxID=7574 RepID=A0A1S3KG70_LINAN|nr:zinc finger protein 225 [Lingula anatina]|eukprot:XP_013421226.1 zinc finger protein 225 [Lingula anatina]
MAAEAFSDVVSNYKQHSEACLLTGNSEQTFSIKTEPGQLCPSETNGLPEGMTKAPDTEICCVDGPCTFSEIKDEPSEQCSSWSGATSSDSCGNETISSALKIEPGNDASVHVHNYQDIKTEFKQEPLHDSVYAGTPGASITTDKKNSAFPNDQVQDTKTLTHSPSLCSFPGQAANRYLCSFCGGFYHFPEKGENVPLENAIPDQEVCSCCKESRHPGPDIKTDPEEDDTSTCCFSIQDQSSSVQTDPKFSSHESELVSNSENKPVVIGYKLNGLYQGRWYSILYDCKICDKIIGGRDEMQKHALFSHEIGTEFRCVCGDPIPYLSSGNGLSYHARVTHGIESLKQFTCTLCEKLVPESDVKAHYEDEHGPDASPFPCGLCGWKLFRKSNYNKHMRKVHRLRYVESCQDCGLRFESSLSLRKHMKEKHASRRHVCEICGYTTKRKSMIDNHKVMHHFKSEQQPCDKCDKVFTSLKSLQRHKECYHAVHQEMCKECGICYDNWENHVCRYDEKKFLCEVCGNFIVNCGKIQHLRSHYNVKLYVCYLCNREFTRKDNLDKHIRVHTGKMIKDCEYCGKGFVNHSNWKLHTRRHAEIGHEKPDKPDPSLCLVEARKKKNGKSGTSKQKNNTDSKKRPTIKRPRKHVSKDVSDCDTDSELDSDDYMSDPGREVDTLTGSGRKSTFTKRGSSRGLKRKAQKLTSYVEIDSEADSEGDTANNFCLEEKSKTDADCSNVVENVDLDKKDEKVVSDSKEVYFIKQNSEVTNDVKLNQSCKVHLIRLEDMEKL